MDNDFLRNSDGTWKYTNRLINSKSLYLLQHAHDPIDWYDWCEEAFVRAKAENKPIFVSIGYYSCYWCNVMGREILSSQEIGDTLNKHFINIKVDKEEHPDLDKIYMSARQILTGESGWPNNIFLTHDLKPFFAIGTLIRAHNKLNFQTLLLKLEEWWRLRHDDLINNASNITNLMHVQLDKISSIAANDIILDEQIVEKLSDQLGIYFDIQHGGFFGAPKFPNESYTHFLLSSSENPQAFFMAFHTLNKIAKSAMYDHVDGGFHRYTIGAAWRIPHFEKMLYNQSLLSNCYLNAYSITKNQYYKNILDSNLKFVQTSLQNENGGFYSSIDAETNHVPGKYYTWDKAQIKSALSDAEYKEFFSYFELEIIQENSDNNISNISNISKQGVLFCNNYDIEVNYIKIKPILEKLRLIRAQRNHPNIDTKIITSWHSMMTTTYANAGLILNNSLYTKIAKKAANFLVENCINKKNELMHIVGNDSIEAFSEDYAYAIQALLALYRLTAEKYWLQKSLDLLNKCNTIFLESDGSYVYTNKKNDYMHLILVREAHDVTIPSANSIMLDNLVQICELTNNKIWLEQANKLINSFTQEIILQPMRFPYFLSGVYYKLMLEKAFKHVKLVNIDVPILIYTMKTITIYFYFEIDNNYYIYAHDNSNFYPTTFNISGSSNLTLHDITYPNVTDKVKLYKKHFHISANISFNNPSNLNNIERLDVTLYYQLCSENNCLYKDKLYEKVFVAVQNSSFNKID
ncbi:Thioredoxin-related protein [Rickettsiales bacterium Ac37b]|nr:Thioredoxin-related protein [Rickettsiales bacterium Ac37b]